MRIEVKGIDELMDKIKNMPEQIPYATMTGLNNLAFMVKTAEQSAMKTAFPTARPATIKNVFVKKATKQNLVAIIHHDQIFPNSWDVGNYLGVHTTGGNRAMKPSERRLGFYYVPASKRNTGMIDKYGNIKGGLVTMLLSKMGRFGDVAGYAMNSRGKGTGRGRYANSEFFMSDGRKGLAAGIWQRVKSGRPFPWLIRIKSAPLYHKRFGFQEIGRSVVEDNFKRVFNEAIDKAINTAR